MISPQKPFQIIVTGPKKSGKRRLVNIFLWNKPDCRTLYNYQESSYSIDDDFFQN